MSSCSPVDRTERVTSTSTLCHTRTGPNTNTTLTDTTDRIDQMNGGVTLVEIPPPFTFDRVTSGIVRLMNNSHGEDKQVAAKLVSAPQLSYRDPEGDIITVSSECEFNEMMRLRAAEVALNDEAADADCVMVDHSNDCVSGSITVSVSGTDSNIVKAEATGDQTALPRFWITFDQAPFPNFPRSPVLDEYECMESQVRMSSSASPLPSESDLDEWQCTDDSHHESQTGAQEVTLTAKDKSESNHRSDCINSINSILTNSISAAWSQVLIQTRDGLQLLTNLDKRNVFASSLKSFKPRWNLASWITVLFPLLLLFLRVMLSTASSDGVVASVLHSNEAIEVIAQLQEEIHYLKEQVAQRDVIATMQWEQMEQLQSSNADQPSSCTINGFWQPIKQSIQSKWVDQWTLAEQLFTSCCASLNGTEEFLHESTYAIDSHFRNGLRTAQQTLVDSIRTVTDSIVLLHEHSQSVDLKLPVAIVTSWWEEMALGSRLQQTIHDVWQYSTLIVQVSQQQEIDVGFVIIDRLLELWNTPIFVSE